ncbi:MAG: type IV toxin-antitoxin system AbiEi family antitoxin domain-containing protein [Candidatus Hydrogenedens sp.]|jgi:predicted transcriptional regulator of viral defense system|nr:type IV toxin-antitoxin system AbiEi family antitoxin domain-containing protein [Candidatus Hydrogenedens sp.]
MKSTTAKIMEHINSLPLGEPFTLQEFVGMGSRAAVDQALSRMTKAGHLSRVARGVYVRPKISPHVGEVPPEAFSVAKVIARKTGSQIQVSGAEAARRMGFTTQVPTRSVFYTNGPSRRIALGNVEIILKKISRQKLALAGRPAGIALTALWYLGKDAVTTESIKQIKSKLPQNEFDLLCSSLRFMPGWMHDAFIKFKREQCHV